MPIKFVYTVPFLNDIRRLRKRYRLVVDDLDALLAEMQDKDYRGAYVPGYDLAIYKVRLANRSARRGKRGGFRAIYHPLDDHNFLFLHIYSKSDKGDVGASEMRKLLRDLN